LQAKVEALPVSAELREAAVLSEAVRQDPELAQGEGAKQGTMRGLLLVWGVLIAGAGAAGQQGGAGLGEAPAGAGPGVERGSGVKLRGGHQQRGADAAEQAPEDDAGAVGSEEAVLEPAPVPHGPTQENQPLPEVGRAFAGRPLLVATAPTQPRPVTRSFVRAADPSLRKSRKRFSRWAHKGVWAKLFGQFQDEDLEWLVLDSTIIRAHPPATGAKKKPTARAGRPSRLWARAGAAGAPRSTRRSAG